MKRTLLMIMLLSLLGVAGSQAADRRNFWLLNNTGHKINRFYIAAHGTGQPWGNDVLGEAALPDTLGVVVFFRDSNSRCMYDFRVVFSDGSYQD